MPKRAEQITSKYDRFRYIGIDPGKSGGLASLNPWTWKVHQALAMPDTDRDIYNWFNGFAFHHGQAAASPIAVLEKVGGYVGGNPTPGSAMFNFGVNYGLLRMALVATGIPFEEIAPRTWQKALGISPRKKAETKAQWKARLKQRAQQLFPEAHVTLATADAILIAEFCRRRHEWKL